MHIRSTSRSSISWQFDNERRPGKLAETVLLSNVLTRYIQGTICFQLFVTSAMNFQVLCFFNVVSSCFFPCSGAGRPEGLNEGFFVPNLDTTLTCDHVWCRWSLLALRSSPPFLQMWDTQIHLLMWKARQPLLHFTSSRMVSLKSLSKLICHYRTQSLSLLTTSVPSIKLLLHFCVAACRRTVEPTWAFGS